MTAATRSGLSVDREFVITASNMHRVMAGSRAYAQQLIDARANRAATIERAQSRGQDASAATAWGHKWEPAARAAYELRTGEWTEPGAWTVHPRIPYVGGTPDAVMPAARGGAEFKCPEDPGNHLLFLASQKLPDAHWWQVQCYLWISGAEWWDYVSFDPRCAVEELAILRVFPDNEALFRMGQQCEKFWAWVSQGAVPEAFNPLAGGVPVFFKR